MILLDGFIYFYKGILEIVEGDFEWGIGFIVFCVCFLNLDGLLKYGVIGKVCMMI